MINFDAVDFSNCECRPEEVIIVALDIHRWMRTRRAQVPHQSKVMQNDTPKVYHDILWIASLSRDTLAYTAIL